MRNRGLFLFLLFAVLWAFPACQPEGDESSPEAATDAAYDGPFLLVVNKSSNTLSVVNPLTLQEVKTIPVGFAPHEVAVSLDGRFAYVTNYGTGERPGNSLTVVDLGNYEAVGTLSVAPNTRPHGVAVALDGTLWVTTEGSGHVVQLDPVSGEILQAVATGQSVTHQVALAPEAGRVITANIGSGTATIIDPQTEAVVTHVATGEGAEGLTVHPDGMRAFVTNRAAGTLVEVDLVTNAITRSMDVGAFPIRVKVRPGGQELLVSNAEGNEVVEVDLERWEIVRRLPVGAAPIGILISPDNRTAYVANTRDDKVTVIDLEAWAVVGEIIAGDEPDGLAWTG
jgi:YVTN family beta-propeller protein